MADWLGGIVGGLGGLGNALMALRQLQNQESLTKMRLMEGQGTWVPTPTQGNFLQNLLSIAPEGMARVGNQSYQLQPFPMLGEEGARALGFAQPVTMPPDFIGAPPPPQVSPWAAQMRMDPRTMQALMQQQLLDRRQVEREAAAQRLMQARQEAIDARTAGQQERMFDFMRQFYGAQGGAEAPVSPSQAVSGGATLPAPSALPGSTPPLPAPRPAGTRPAPSGGSFVLPAGYERLPESEQVAFNQRQALIDLKRREIAGLAQKPSLSMGGVAMAPSGRIAALKDEVSALEKQQNDALAQVQGVAKVGAETTQRLEATQAFKDRAVQQAEQYIAVGDWKGAQHVMSTSGIPDSQWPEDLQRRKKVFESQLKTSQQANRLAEQASQYSDAALKAWEQLNGMVQGIFTVPGGDPLARVKQRLSLEKQAIMQTPGEGMPDVATYEDTALAHIITITKALTGTGRMAASEVFQMLRGLPTIHGRGGLPDSREVAARKMKNIYELLQAAGKRPINPSKAFDLQEAHPAERDPAKRFQPVPVLSGANSTAGESPSVAPTPTEMSDEEIEAEIKRLEGGK